MYVPSSELGLPQPLSRKRVCPPPADQRGGGAHWPAGEGVGEFNSNDWRKSSAYILCGALVKWHIVNKNRTLVQRHIVNSVQGVENSVDMLDDVVFSACQLTARLSTSLLADTSSSP